MHLYRLSNATIMQLNLRIGKFTVMSGNRILAQDFFMKVTIYDIAKEAQTSPSTVSRVLNSSSLISDEKSEKILKAAEKLGYQKRSIRKQRGRAVLSIKLVLGRLKDKKLPMFYSVPDLIQGIQDGVPDNKLNIICETSNDPELLFANKKSGHTDAVIFAFTNVPKKTIKHLEDNSIPFLILNRAPVGQDFIAFNNEEDTLEVAKAAFNKRKNLNPCFLEINPKHEVTIERRRGYMRACEEFNIEKPIVETIKDVAALDSKLIKSLNKKGINCIIAMNDTIASKFMIFALDAGFHIPKDFSLTGFDGSTFNSMLPRKLDTISLEIHDLGQKSGEWIHKRVISREDQKFQIRISGKHLKGDTL